MMRKIITKKDWNRVYYYHRERWFQRKMVNESPEAETAKVIETLTELHKMEMIPHTTYNREKFYDFRKLVHENFFIYWTAINPPMEHILYALSDILRPKNILGLGVFTGNPVVWSMGPALNKTYSSSKLVGVELNKDHARIGQDNFNEIRGDIPVAFLGEDGFDVLDRYQDNEIDLLYLDANGKDPETGKSNKRINYSLLKKAYTKIRPGGWAMCHNAYQRSFKREAESYLTFTADESKFSHTATIGIDEQGLEFSLKIK
jgi:predicted O-methyltransferase YrrM